MSAFAGAWSLQPRWSTGPRICGMRRGGSVVKKARSKVMMAEAPTEVTYDEKTNKFYAGKSKRELSQAEKEALFMDASHALYEDTDPLITDEQFDRLQEELSWEGSRVVLMSDEEMKFLEAARAYKDGKQTMSDDEYDRIKDKLRRAGSPIVIREGARCSVVTQTCVSDMKPDKLRNFSLYAPVAGIAMLAWAFVSFEFTPLRVYNPLLAFFVGIPGYWLATKLFTNIFLPNPTILVGDCPSCEQTLRVYFGDAIGVKGFSEVAELKCPKCKSNIKVQREAQRAETLPKPASKNARSKEPAPAQ